MPSIQAAPAQVYPVGETIVPSSPGQQQFPQRTIDNANLSFPADQFTDPDTAIDFLIEVQLPDNSWALVMQATAVGSSGGWKTRNNTVITTLIINGAWYSPITVKGARARITVRDAVAGSGLAKPVSLGAMTLTWNLDNIQH